MKKIAIIITCLVFLFLFMISVFGSQKAHADTTYFTGSKLTILDGHGEFKNNKRTDRTEIRGQINLVTFNNVGLHLAAKHEILKSLAVDDPEHSLINGNRTMFGVGLHSSKGTTATLYANDKYWEFEAENRRPIRWGLKSIMGIDHLNLYKKGRKTTRFKVGLAYQFTPSTECEATVTTGNNTAHFVDDYVLFGCTYLFGKRKENMNEKEFEFAGRNLTDRSITADLSKAWVLDGS